MPWGGSGNSTCDETQLIHHRYTFQDWNSKRSALLQSCFPSEPTLHSVQRSHNGWNLNGTVGRRWGFCVSCDRSVISPTRSWKTNRERPPSRRRPLWPSWWPGPCRSCQQQAPAGSSRPPAPWLHSPSPPPAHRPWRRFRTECPSRTCLPERRIKVERLHGPLSNATPPPVTLRPLTHPVEPMAVVPPVVSLHQHLGQAAGVMRLRAHCYHTALHKALHLRLRDQTSAQEEGGQFRTLQDRKRTNNTDSLADFCLFRQQIKPKKPQTTSPTAQAYLRVWFCMASCTAVCWQYMWCLRESRAPSWGGSSSSPQCWHNQEKPLGRGAKLRGGVELNGGKSRPRMHVSVALCEYGLQDIRN